MFNPFKKKVYTGKSHSFYKLNGDGFFYRPIEIRCDHNYQEKEVQAFLRDLSNMFWLLPVKHKVDFVGMNNNCKICTDLTTYTFSGLVLASLALIAEIRLDKKDNIDDVREVLSVFATCIYLYMKSCSWRTRRKVIKVFKDESLFGFLGYHRAIILMARE